MEQSQWPVDHDKLYWFGDNDTHRILDQKIIKSMNNHEKLEQIAESIAIWMGSLQSIYIHTIFFALMFCLRLFGVTFNSILLMATTVVSFEAIYLNIFIQLSLNNHSKHLKKHNEILEQLKK